MFRSRYYRGGSTSIGYIRCEICGDLSNGHHLCGYHELLVIEHEHGEHTTLVFDCPECLLLVS